jgi:translation initiation factor 1 (eIF-1/SUI1)
MNTQFLNNKYKSDSDSDSDNDTESETNFTSKNILSAPVKDKVLTRKALKNIKLLKQQKENETNSEEFNKDIDFQSPIFDISGEAKIHIRIQARNSRKTLTIIEGIPKHFLESKDNNKKILTKIQNTISSRATLKYNELKEPIIELSGSKYHLVIPIIKELTSYLDEDIIIHDI